ncbi:MAG: hemerythrin family protein [Pseudomonadota bacterium]|nr:hemerythrin family protein [Pseudomonadota bacterium]
MKRRGIGQKIAYYTAIVFYFAGFACIPAAWYWAGQLGTDHPVIASLGASVVFFVGAGIVLHVIGRTNIPNLSFRHEDDDPPAA